MLREGSHGLFSDDGTIVQGQLKEELQLSIVTMLKSAALYAATHRSQVQQSGSAL